MWRANGDAETEYIIIFFQRSTLVHLTNSPQPSPHALHPRPTLQHLCFTGGLNRVRLVRPSRPSNVTLSLDLPLPLFRLLYYYIGGD
jgi:hypothetical protein